MKKLVFALPFVLLACSAEEQSTEESTNGGTDEATQHLDITDPAHPDYVDPSVQNVDIDTNTSTVNWERFKKVKNANISLGNFSMNVGNLEYTTEGDFPIESGYWQVIDNEIMMAEVILDLTQVAALQINDENKLDVVSPNYLDVDEYPSAMLLFKSFKQAEDGSNIHSCIVELTLKGKTKPIEAVAEFDWLGEAPAEMACSFTINGVEWGLVNPDVDADIEVDEFTLNCIIKTVRE